MLNGCVCLLQTKHFYLLHCRGNKFVECPYTGARFQPQCTGELSPVGNVAKIGADVSGLMCSPVQVR